MNQTNLNPNQSETTLSDNAFQTPWQKRFFGKQEQLVLSRNPNGLVTAQIISKDSQNVFKQITEFFGRKQDDLSAEKPTIEIEKKFTNISIKRFENELKEIQKLLDKHTSMTALLKQVEKDLDGQHPSYPPEITTLNPKITEERRQTVQQMRNELEALIIKIDEEEASPELQSYEQLKSSIERIKKAATSAFSKINALQECLNDPKVSTAQLQQLSAEIKQIDANNEDWSRDFATVRKIELEKQALQTEIDLHTSQMKFCAPEMKKQWEVCMARWKNLPISELSSLEQIQHYRQEMNKTIAKIGDEYQKELSKKVTLSFTELQEHFDATTPDFANHNKQQAHLDFRTQVLTIRKKTWFSLNEIWRQSANNLELIEQLQQCIIKEQALDKALVKTLQITTDQESYLEKAFSFLSPLTSMISPLIPSLPSIFEFYQKPSLLSEKERFDEASIFYVNQTLQRTRRMISRLLELIPNGDEEGFIEDFDYLLQSNSLLQSDLNVFLEEIISFSQEAISSKDEESDLDSHSINLAISELQGQKEVLSVILKSQQEHAGTIIKKAKVEYSRAFEQTARPSIVEAAQETANHLFPENSADLNLRTLSTDWQNARTVASTQLETLKYLEILENLQKEYREIALKRQKEINTLSGEEKTNANIALEAMNQAIDSLDEMLNEYQVDASMVISYKTKLLKINHSFDPLFEIENQKKELRFNLNKEINAFTAHLEQCVQAVDEIEKHYSIQLKEAKELIKNKREMIKEWKEHGILPPSYLKLAPISALPSILYYGASQLPFEDRNVLDLNVSDLAFYIENLKAVIINQKSDLSSHCILESFAALKTFQVASQNLETHIKNLIGGIKVKVNFSGENQYQIPEGLSSTDVAKLQFHNASLTSERQKNLLSQQTKAFTSKPNLKFIYQTLKNDTHNLTSIYEQSKRGTTLSLLDQIEKLSNNPNQQILAKRTFIETITTKLSDHTKMMTGQAKTFKNHPKIYDEAIRQIKRTEQDFFKRLKNSPKGIQLHAEGWHVIKDGNTLNFSTKDNLPIESLSVNDLKSYVESIEKTIKQGNDYIRLIKGTYNKAEQASKKFQDKIKEAKITLNDLDRKDQLIDMQRLKNIIAHAEKAKDDYATPPESAEEGLLASLNFLVTPSKNTHPTHTALRLLEDYKKNIGDSISKIDAALKKIRQGKILTLAEQLAANPDSKTTEELRQRFQSKIQPIIDSTRQTLQSYQKNGKAKLALAFTRYVSPSSKLLKEIEKSIDDQLLKLDQFEKGHRSRNRLSNLVSVLHDEFDITPLAELSSSEMSDYFRELTRLQKTLENDLNKKFQINSLIDAQVNYEHTLNEIVKKQASKLRANGLFTDAFLLERKVDEVVEKEAKWVEKITHGGQFKDLVAELKKFNREMSWAIDEFNPKKIPSSYEDQIRILLSRKEEYSSNTFYSLLVTDQKNQDILDQIDADINTLKNKMVNKIDEGYEKHQNDLLELKSDIDEIYTTYSINLQPKQSVLDAIDSEITRFEYEASKFATSYYPIVDRLTNSNRIVQLLTNGKKHIEDMNPEEIVQLRPEKNHQALIDGSLKKISTAFNYKLIQKPHVAYKECLEKAERTCAKLIKKEQIVHAYDLETKIKSIKKAHENCCKDKIVNNDQLAGLSKKLMELSSRLKAAESTAISLPDIDITEQIDQLNMIDPSSPYCENLKTNIVKNIQDIIDNQKKSVNKSMKYIDNLVKQIGLPYQWRETITNELDKCVEELEYKHLSLIAQYSKNPPDRPKHTNKSFIDQFGKQIGVPEKWSETVSNKVDNYWENVGNYLGDIKEKNPKPAEAAKTVYNYSKKIYDYLKTPTGDLPLSELNLNDLVSIQKTLKIEEDKVKQVDKKYRLKSLNEQLKSYEIQLNTIETLKKDWTSNYNFKSAENLDKLLSACNKEFEKYFELRTNNNLQNNMHDLFSYLKETTDNLYYATAKLKKIKPQTLGKLLQAEEVGSPEYDILKKAVRKQIVAKISEHKKALTAYFKKIDLINENILRKIPDCPSLPINWRKAVEDKINTKQHHLEQLEIGLPYWNAKNGDWDWKPFEDLTKKEIWLYETYVNHVAAKDDKNKNSTSFLSKLEQLIHLEEIEKYFSHFQKATKDLEAAIAKPNNLKDKKTTLESMLGATNQLVFSLINNLESFSDTNFFLQTLEQGQATLYSASQETEPLVIKTDPWAEILEYEESKVKGSFPSASFEHVISNGFQISYKSIDNNLRKDQICNVIPLKQIIANIKSHFEETKTKSEITSTYMRDQGYDKHPEYKKLVEYHTFRIPEILDELTKLETEATIIDNHGNVSQLKVNEIATFKDLLNYKNRLDKVRGDFYGEEEKIFESDFLNWCHQYQKAKETQENNEGAIVVTEIDPEFSNIEIDSESDIDIDFGSHDSKSAISKKSKSNKNKPSHSNAPKSDVHGMDTFGFPVNKKKENESKDISNDPLSFNANPDKLQKSKSQSKVFVPYQEPQIKLNTLPTDMKKTIEKNIDKVKILTECIEQMNKANIQYAYLYSNVGDEDIEALEDLAEKQQDNQPFMNAYQTFKSLWNELHSESIKIANKKIGTDYIKVIEQILPFKENAVFIRNLTAAFDNIMKDTNASTLNESILHLKNLCQAGKIKIQLENIAKYCRQIYEMHLNADKVLDDEQIGGKSSILSAFLVEKWLKELDYCSNISSKSDLDAIEEDLKTLADNCGNILKEDNRLRNKKTSLHQEIEEFERKFKKKIDFIQTEYGGEINPKLSPIAFIEISAYKKINLLKEKKLNKEKELNDVNLNQLESNKNKTFQEIEKTWFKEGYVAAKKYKNLLSKAEIKIKNLCSSKQFATAEKIKVDLESARPLFSLIKWDFKEFADKMEQCIQKIEKSVEKEYPPIDYISQLDHITDANAFTDIANAIIDGFIETAKKIEENSNIIIENNSSLPHQIIDKLKEINFNYQTLITESKNLTKPANKEDFTIHVYDTKRKSTEALETITNINKALELAGNLNNFDKTNIPTCIKNADHLLKTLTEIKKPKAYFCINKVQKLRADLILSAKTFMECFNNPQETVETFIEKAKKLENFLNNFDSMLEKINNSKQMNLFEQLEAANVESGILSPELEQKIIDAIKKYGKNIILEAINTVKEYEDYADHFPGIQTSQIAMIISAVLEKFKNLKREIVDVKDPNSLKQWIKTIRKEEAAAVNDLESILKLKTHKKDLKAYQSLVKRITNLLLKNEDKLFKHEEVLRDVMQNIETLRQQLLENFTDFKTYWTKLNEALIGPEKLIEEIIGDSM